MENTGESPGSIRLARRDQRSLIPRHAHAPAPSPSRRWSIRCIALALVTDGNLGTPLAPRFRLRFGCAPLHSVSSPLYAPLRSAPARRPLDRSAIEPFSMTQPQPSKGVIRRGTSLSEDPVLLRQARQKEHNHVNGLPVRLICAKHFARVKMSSYGEFKRLEARSRMAAIRQARKSPRSAAALQRRASLVGNGEWRITNLREVVEALSKRS